MSSSNEKDNKLHDVRAVLEHDQGNQLSGALDAKQQFLCDVMTTAIEGGIGYWAVAQDIKRDTELNVLSFRVRDAEEANGKHSWTKITPDLVDEAIKTILSGSVELSKHIMMQFVGYPHKPYMCDFDADGADCVVQIAAFGEVVFG